MIRTLCRTGLSGLASALVLSLSVGGACAESLNPEGVNPHAAAPRKRITQEQKNAAAEARKTRKAGIATRKSGRNAIQLNPINPASSVTPATEKTGK